MHLLGDVLLFHVLGDQAGEQGGLPHVQVGVRLADRRGSLGDRRGLGCWLGGGLGEVRREGADQPGRLLEASQVRRRLRLLVGRQGGRLRLGWRRLGDRIGLRFCLGKGLEGGMGGVGDLRPP